MKVRRHLYLAWLALTLNALAPIFAYAHVMVGANGEMMEHCAVGQAGDDGPSHHHSNSDTVPHCPYCPGFTAGAPLAQFAVGPLQQVVPISLLPGPRLQIRSGPSSVRIAQPRAPPSFFS
ncbi:MAG: DUF2946 domain-containing protein [Casimicrobiaceae bacterium]